MSGWGAIYNNTRYSISTLSEALARLQEQASTGSRIVRASDDPNDALRVLCLKHRSLDLAGYAENLDSVSLNLDEASSSLQGIYSSLSRVQELTTQASSQTYGGANRRSMAEEVDSLLEQVLSLANHETLGRYVFGGAGVSSAPYVAQRSGGAIVTVGYEGSDAELPVPVGPGVQCSGLLVGERVFRGSDRHDPQFLGNTGAKAGSATSTVQGDVWLILGHAATAYDDGGAGSGIAAGTGSVTGDTILGGHTLTVNAAARTLKLDGGPAVNFTNETNLEVTSGAGDKVHVDVSGYNGTFDGDITLTGAGTASIDEGASSAALTAGDFTNQNFKVTDSRTGRILYVSATGITRTGLEPVRVTGTYDMFGTLIQIRDLMRNTHNLTESQQVARLNETIGSLKEVMTGIQQHVTSVGGRQGAMESLKTSLGELKANADTEGQNLESADIAQVATDLARTQTLYQMSLQVAAKLMSLNLLDFMPIE